MESSRRGLSVLSEWCFRAHCDNIIGSDCFDELPPNPIFVSRRFSLWDVVKLAAG